MASAAWRVTIKANAHQPNLSMKVSMQDGVGTEIEAERKAMLDADHLGNVLPDTREVGPQNS